MRVHAIEAGRLRGNERAMRATGPRDLFRRRRDYEFPAYVFVIERPDGLLAIDTGMNATPWSTLGPARRFIPSALPLEAEGEIGPRMRALGLDPAEVRTVVVTHLDVDHVGGVEHFPNAEFLVHRPEHEFAATFRGRLRYQPKRWPASFEPTIYDLDPEPCGPFPESRALADDGRLRLVPLPGHSIGQVGVVAETDEATLFFVADHVLRQDWMVEDFAAGNLKALGALMFPGPAVETSRRLESFVAERPTVLLPAHDSEAPGRLERMEVLAR